MIFIFLSCIILHIFKNTVIRKMMPDMASKIPVTGDIAYAFILIITDILLFFSSVSYIFQLFFCIVVTRVYSEWLRRSFIKSSAPSAEKMIFQHFINSDFRNFKKFFRAQTNICTVSFQVLLYHAHTSVIFKRNISLIRNQSSVYRFSSSWAAMRS